MAARCFVLALALAIGQIAEVSAQLVFPVRQTSNRLFGRGRADPNRRSLGLSGSLHGGYDTDVLAGITDRRSTGGNPQSGGLYGAGAGLTFRQPGPVNINASAQTARAFAPTVTGANRTSRAVRGTVASNRRLTRELSVQASGEFGYTSQTDPSSQVFESFDAVEFPSVGRELFGVELSSRGVVRERGQAGLSYDTSRRGRLVAGYQFNKSDVIGHNQGLREQSATVSYRHDVGRYMGAQLGYSYGRSRHVLPTGRAATFPSSRILATIDYNRDLTPQMSRRTTLSLRAGTNVVGRQPLETPTDQSDRLAFVTASAGLLHELGRTWSAQITYGRDLRFLDGFGEPIITEGVSSQIGGAVTRRLGFSAFSQYAKGKGVSRGLAPTFTTFQSSAQLQLALTRYASMFTQVYRTVYDSGVRGLSFPLLVPQNLRRYGVRFGVSLWTSLLN